MRTIQIKLFQTLFLLLGIISSLHATNTLSENQQYIDEIIHSEVRMGFLALSEIEESVIEAVQDNGFTKEISTSWVRSQIKQKHQKLLTESKSWKHPTDTALLIQAFDELVQNHIMALHNVWLTTADGDYEVEDLLKTLKKKHIKRPLGYCFYHEQDLERAIDPSVASLYLSFGTLEKYNDANIIKTGKQIVAILKKYHFQIHWNETANKRIEIINFNWQKLYDPTVDLMDYTRVVEMLSQ